MKSPQRSMSRLISDRGPPPAESDAGHNRSHYRPDIDGLRAIAVAVVIAFHLGWLPYGFLGVDVFFVISGYLITGICVRELRERRFSVWQFYLRRVRRILPLVCVIVAVSLLIGCITMLPDDLENLASSVIATNLCANNILQAITTRNYWDVVNEFKPLMHTWSLGVEEQFYLVYPILIWGLAARRPRLFRSVVAALALLSLAMFLAKEAGYATFYFIQYRFFELASGGILVAVVGDRHWRLRLGWLWLLALAALLAIELPVSATVRLLLVVTTTLALLASDNTSPNAGWSKAILTHPIAVYLGLMSFSLYMWHQVLLANARYCLVPAVTPSVAAALLAACVVLSWLTWRFVERPFRDPRRCPTPVVLAFVGLMMLLTTGAAGVIYARAGVIRDVPELEIRRDDVQRGMHAAYNDRSYAYDRPFHGDSRLKVLVVGDSFMGDWTNVLLESPLVNDLEVSYTYRLDEEAMMRARDADIVYVQSVETLARVQEVASADVWIVGTKSFGASTGIHYNRPRDKDYCGQRAMPEPAVVVANESMRLLAADRYIDLMGRVMDSEGTVPVFTPDCRFISQDTRHLTRAGAQYFGELFTPDIRAQVDFATHRAGTAEAPTRRDPNTK